MIKGKALKRALETNDAIRLNGDVPLIVDKTELITPEIAQEMLKHNTNNRPINWKKVEEYAEAMKKGEWKLHSQGIIFDPSGNLLTGQKRLWAVVYSGTSVYMRVSRGCPADTVRILDRGTPQSDKDLAARETKRKHTQTEAAIARAILVLAGKKPTTDSIADIMVSRAQDFELVLGETKGTKKTRSVLMVFAAMFSTSTDGSKLSILARHIEKLSDDLNKSLLPSNADECWGRGVAFVLALEQAKRCVEEQVKTLQFKEEPY